MEKFRLTCLHQSCSIHAMFRERHDLDPIVFGELAFNGEPETFLGEVGDIVRSGRYYSLNRGAKVGGNEILVLDTEAKTMTRCVFNSNFGQWTGRRFSIDPRKGSTGNVGGEYLYEAVTDFFSKMKQVIPGLEKKDAEKVKHALSKAAEPLLKHFQKELCLNKKRVKKLSSMRCSSAGKKNNRRDDFCD